MTQLLRESGMKIIYEETSAFFIEKSKIVNRLQGVKIVEFVEADGKDHIKMIEAKTSSPQQTNAKHYSSYIREIIQKFQNSILLINAAKLGRRKSLFEEFPQPLKEIDYAKAHYRLFLIIKKCKDEWLPPLADDLRIHLHPFLKCWGIADEDFKVINEDFAKTLKLIK